MNLGLLDLPAPVLAALDGALAWLGLPALVRVIGYALASAWLCMTLYRRWSRQQELGQISQASLALRQELQAYDGPFDGLMQRVRQLLALNGRHLRLSFVPAMLSGLPLLLLLPWLSNQFSLQFPPPGTPVRVLADGLQQPLSALSWSDPGVSVDATAQAWLVPWPAPDQTLQLRYADQTLLALPLAAPSDQVHAWLPALNWLVANPAGYLPAHAPLTALRLELPVQQLHGLGPQWLGGWLTIYLSAMVLASLYLKWRWQLK